MLYPICSPTYGYKFDYSTLLGGVRRNSSGHVIGAVSAVSVWVSSVDETKMLIEEGGTGVELDLADPATLAWERTLIEEMKQLDSRSEQDGINVLINVGRR